jgi:uncharacterized protein (TIGR02301 family)
MPRFALVLLIVSSIMSTAFAAPRTEPPAPPAEPAAPPPYQAQILRLAELLGVLAYMTDLCNAPDAGTWPTRMGALLGSEGQATGTRDVLAGAYNRGFRGYEATYRSCTPNAQLVISRTLDEAGRLTGTIVSRFGAF